jgi:hypothetical protein
MAQAEQARQFVIGEVFPGGSLGPGETSGFDRTNGEAFLKPCFDLLPQPIHVSQFFQDGGVRMFADDDARNIRDFRPESVDVAVTFDQDFDVEFG